MPLEVPNLSVDVPVKFPDISPNKIAPQVPASNSPRAGNNQLKLPEISIAKAARQSRGGRTPRHSDALTARSSRGPVDHSPRKSRASVADESCRSPKTAARDRRNAFQQSLKRRSKNSVSVAKIKLSSTQVISLKDLLYLKAYFDDLDVNGDGTVDMAEITNHMRSVYAPDQSTHRTTPIKLPANFLSSLKKKIEDKEEEGEGRITFADMLRLVYTRATKNELALMAQAVRPKEKAEGTPGETTDTADIDAMWALWDTDQSGELDEMEFREVLKGLGVDPSEISDLYKQVDADQSGCISKQEFTDWWCNMGKEHEGNKADSDVESDENEFEQMPDIDETWSEDS